MSLSTAPTSDGIAQPLLVRLEQHVSQARGLLQQPQDAQPSSQVGYLEGVWADWSGLIWLVGWMIEDAVVDRPVFVLDTARHAAGVAVSFAPRADLGPDAKAFVAVLRADWQAGSDLPPQLVFADGSGRFLEPVRPWPVTSAEAVLPIVRDILERSSGPHRAAMRALFQANRLRPSGDDTLERVQIDEVAFLPGFGAFVNGWALSPCKRAESFVLKAGNHVIAADQLSQFRFARSDISQTFPNVAQALESAAFVTLFRGDLHRDAVERLTLKIGWDDGSSTIVSVPPAMVRVLGLTVPLDSIRRFYPALEAERFFADFAYQAAAQARFQSSRVQGYDINPVASAVLLAAPRQRSDIFLLFDRAARHAASLPVDWGLAIIASADENRGLVLTLFAELQRTASHPCSLFFMSDAEPTSDVIDEVAAKLSCTRFAWVDGNLSLTARGWHELGRVTNAMVLLATDDAMGGGTGPGGELHAFVADISEWRRIYSLAPPQIGGVRLPTQSIELPAVSHAAEWLQPPLGSPFTLKINEAARRAHG